jgi:hypothetical protein
VFFFNSSSLGENKSYTLIINWLHFCDLGKNNDILVEIGVKGENDSSIPSLAPLKDIAQ